MREFTDNDILEEVYRQRQEDKNREKSMQRQAWYTLLAGLNRPSFGFEHEWQDFTVVFPDEVAKPNIEELETKCAQIGLRPPRE